MSNAHHGRFAPAAVFIRPACCRSFVDRAVLARVFLPGGIDICGGACAVVLAFHADGAFLLAAAFVILRARDVARALIGAAA